MAINTGQDFTESTPESAELIQATPGEITLPEGFSLTTADFAQLGADLVLTATDGEQIVIRDFFAQGDLPELVSAEGAHVPGELAAKLAGPLAPGQVTQAGPLTQAEPIGQVENVDGEVVAIRPDGTRVELEVGDPVYQGDVLESGEDGAIGIVLADETSFSMAESGRMTLDEMVYDPGTQEGTIALSVVQGVFTFISGEVAKADPDAMTVQTPVATIGIRGTQIGIAFKEGEELKLVLMEEGDGFVGEIVVTNEGGVQILNQANQGVTVTSIDAAPSNPETVSPEAIAETYGSALVNMPESANVNTYGAEEAAAEGETEEAAAEDENLEDFATAAGGDEGDAGDVEEIPDLGLDGGEGDDTLVDEPEIVFVPPEPEPEPEPVPTPEPVVVVVPPVAPTPTPVDPVDPPSFSGLTIPFDIPAGPSDGPVTSVSYSSPSIDGITEVSDAEGGDYLEGDDLNDSLTGSSVGEFYDDSDSWSNSWSSGWSFDGGYYAYDYYYETDYSNEYDYAEIYAYNELDGYGGDDLLIGGLGENYLYGGDGNDVLVGGSEYNIYDETESYSETRSGYDSYRYDFSNVSYRYDYDDTWSEDSNYVDYEAYQDLYGDSGDDTMIGGVGDVYMDGGSGNDVMVGATGYNWWTEGGSGSETYQRTNVTNFDGDEGSTGFDWDGEMTELDQSVTYTYSGWGNYSHNNMYGGSGDDEITAGVGSYHIYGDAGEDLITLGSGLEEEYYEESGTASGYTFSEGGSFGEGIFSEGTIQNFGEGGGRIGGSIGEGVDISNISLDGEYSMWAYRADAHQSAYGGDDNDEIIGGVGDMNIRGDAGDDVISGSSGYNLEAFSGTAADGNANVQGWSMHAYNSLYGGDGNDDITGGLGDNYIDGDDGNDNLTGGTEFNLEALAAQFVDPDGTTYDIAWESADAYQNLYGGSGEDTLTGGVGRNYIDGGGDDDVITGSTGYNFESFSATVTGADGSVEEVSGEIYEARSDLYGGSGDDDITGGVGYNYMDGGSSNDTLTAGVSNDSYSTGIFSEGDSEGLYADGDYGYDNVMYGGGGDDTFVFNAGGDGYNFVGDFGNGLDSMVFQGAGSADLGFSENARGDLVITAGDTEVVVNNYDLQDVTDGALSIAEEDGDVVITDAPPIVDPSIL